MQRRRNVMSGCQNDIKPFRLDTVHRRKAHLRCFQKSLFKRRLKTCVLVSGTLTLRLTTCRRLSFGEYNGKRAEETRKNSSSRMPVYRHGIFNVSKDVALYIHETSRQCFSVPLSRSPCSVCARSWVSEW